MGSEVDVGSTVLLSDGAAVSETEVGGEEGYKIPSTSLSSMCCYNSPSGSKETVTRGITFLV